ncbi:TetR family transcriptional regulator [Dictyobacter alpinus]|uniref:TetR family transcriptional regulator n=1 Tax=Dictyobacter alpinus TaxID=2014873 RepID=A0A402B6A3_9CHLR|nr:TetR family transcriptional regulator [Dictyobacter alpinus]GCE26893.1 TetR family transcriptional regulator [Dictyobacter alpinus]
MGGLAGRRRAVHDEQKGERRQAILDGAWGLFLVRGYEALTMAEIAGEVGLAKGTLFLYFKTKEALFLALVEQQLKVFFAQLDAQLAVPVKDAPIPAVSEILCAVLTEHPGLTRLLAIVHTILEQHIPDEVALHFKQLLQGHFATTGALLEQQLPFLRAGQGMHVLLQAYVLVLGCWQIADPAPVVRHVLAEHPELAAFDVQFGSEFTIALQALLYGLEHMAQQRAEGDEKR